MKQLKQLTIILLISFIGEMLHMLIPVPIPASIYGLVLMFILLECKILPLSSVKEVGKFLVEILTLMFIPTTVGLIDSYSLVSDRIVPYLIVTLVTTIIVMVVSGRVTQFAIGKFKKGGDKD